MGETDGQKPDDEKLDKVEERILQLERLKRRYDIVKWVAGIGIGLAVGGFTVGAYLRNVVAFIDDRTLPPNMIAFFKASCPPNWVRMDELRGRYIVGVDPNHLDDLGKPVGIALESGRTGRRADIHISMSTLFRLPVGGATG